jgi:uncharacterized delta-60 repeat protein
MEEVMHLSRRSRSLSLVGVSGTLLFALACGDGAGGGEDSAVARPEGTVQPESVPGGVRCSAACSSQTHCFFIGPHVERCWQSCTCPAGTTITPVTGYSDVAYAVAPLGSDGSFLLGGIAIVNGTGYGETGLVKYTSNGVVDSSFGSNGQILVDVTQSTADQIRGLATLPAAAPNGASIIAVGYGFTPIVLFYQSNGSVVQALSAGQIVPKHGDEAYTAVSLYPPTNATTFVAAGYSGTSIGTLDHGFLAARYNFDGTLDTTFAGGTVFVPIMVSGQQWDANAKAVAVQADGKILLAGSAMPPNSNVSTDIAIVRLNTDGSLDQQFGTGGIVMTNVGNYGVASAIQLDDTWLPPRIVVGGFRSGGSPYKATYAIARYNSDGSLDTSFGVNGVSLPDYIPSLNVWATSLSIVYNGAFFASSRYVLGGYTQASFTNDAFDFIVGAVTPTGAIDGAFGTSGLGYTTISASQNYNSAQAGSNAMFQDSSGNLVLAGSVWAGDYNFAATRVSASGALDTSFGQ